MTQIVAAAVRVGSLISFMPRPARHHDIVHALHDADPTGWVTIRREGSSEQGFIDNNGIFLSRKEAYIVATFNGQFNRRGPGGGANLFSEDLW